jgi:hypothetical protein
VLQWSHQVQFGVKGESEGKGRGKGEAEAKQGRQKGDPQETKTFQRDASNGKSKY